MILKKLQSCSIKYEDRRGNRGQGAVPHACQCQPRRREMRRIVLTLAVSSFVALRPDATNAATRSNSTCRACPMPVTTARTRNESHRGAVRAVSVARFVNPGQLAKNHIEQGDHDEFESYAT